MNFNHFAILISVLFQYYHLHAQYVDPYVADAISFKERKVLYVEDFFQNDTQRDWFKKYWKFDQEIRFVKGYEIREVIKSKDENAAILSGRLRIETPKDQHPNDYENEEPGWLNLYWDIRHFIMTAYLPEKGKTWKKYGVSNMNKYEVARYSIHHYPLFQSEVKFFCQHFYNMISYAAGGKGLKPKKVDPAKTVRIKEMKLLIPTSRKSKHYWHDPISEVYPYDMELVTTQEIDKAILDGQENTAYLRIYFSPLQQTMGLYVIECATGEILLETGFKTITVSPGKESEIKILSNYTGYGADQSLKGVKLFVQKKHLSWISQGINKAEKKLAKQ